MADVETSRHIEEKAADWVARLDRGPLSEADSAALERWLDGDPRRRGAFLRANALSMMSESGQALGPDFTPQAFATPNPLRHRGMTRRKWLSGAGGAVAASLIALGVSAPAGAITTGLGEVRLVTLEDGSTVMLNSQTSVKVGYTRNERRVHLLYGEAYFTIVSDPHRAFLVEVADARLSASRAGFGVRKLDGLPVDVLVNQGSVALGRVGSPKPLVLGANTRITLPQADGALPVPQLVTGDLVTRELAWREGKIAFEGERLDQAAAQFARYSRTRIEIRDPDLASEPVTGLFSAGDPVGFSRAVAAIFDARVEQQADRVILSRRTNRT
ncbi:putative transcriptional regulator, putative [Novosphingobium nitrogenifigens DSM 19370]|uniref:Putative transcriptional regulator, putative n=1 Tax=Novosphingobium nitrogenifigens DSM 19370 TaxID=983920 RepID=F1Z3Q0_9SPHN|nr:FecR domain-containing protein [Novosphingobium nitrogenifigens]EGD60763.1 putative transcriptional regulator, putative [Novosphingobium nitrogenifigens DSM 19370]